MIGTAFIKSVVFVLARSIPDFLTCYYIIGTWLHFQPKKSFVVCFGQGIRFETEDVHLEKGQVVGRISGDHQAWHAGPVKIDNSSRDNGEWPASALFACLMH